MILTTSARNAGCNAIVDQLDAGTGPGYFQLETSGDVEIATLVFSEPAFGDAVSGVATAGAISSDTDATGGTVNHASFYDGDDVHRFDMTVGTSSAEIIMSSLTVGAGDTVAADAMTVTMPAS
jgi:hypothetical protein